MQGEAGQPSVQEALEGQAPGVNPLAQIVIENYNPGKLGRAAAEAAGRPQT